MKCYAYLEMFATVHAFPFVRAEKAKCNFSLFWCSYMYGKAIVQLRILIFTFEMNYV